MPAAVLSSPSANKAKIEVSLNQVAGLALPVGQGWFGNVPFGPQPLGSLDWHMWDEDEGTRTD
jgi:hypothetical protein